MIDALRPLKISALALTLAASVSGAAYAIGVGVDTPMTGAGSGSIPFSLQTNTQMSLSPMGLTVYQASATQALTINGNDMWISNTTGGATLYLQPLIANGAVVIGSSLTINSGNTLVTLGGGIVPYPSLPMAVAATYVSIPWFGAAPGQASVPTFGGSPQMFVNGDNHGSPTATVASPNGGGIAISDDGGFYDYNDGWITYNGSNGNYGDVPGQTHGLLIEGNHNGGAPTDGTLYVQGQICLGGYDAAHCVTKLPGAGGAMTQFDIPPDNVWHDLGVFALCYESGTWGAPNGSYQEIAPVSGSPGAYDFQAINSTGSYGFFFGSYGYTTNDLWILCMS